MGLDPQREKTLARWSKRTLLFTGLALVFVAVIWFADVWWQVHTFLKRTVASDTGISTYTTVKDLHNEHHWAAVLAVSPSETQKLLDRYAFRDGYSEAIYAGTKLAPDDHDCLGCMFYFRSTSHYGYRLYRVTADRRTVFIDDEFGS